MEVQDQICSLEQAKRLRELGVVRPDTGNGESGFYYVHNLERPIAFFAEDEGYPSGKYERAFTVAELGRALHLDNSGCPPPGLANMSKMGWLCLAEFLPSNNEADTRAKALIHYLETSSITPEEVNHRLAR